MKTNVMGYNGIQRGLLKDKPQHNYINIKFFFLFAIIKECKIMAKRMITNYKAWLGALALFVMVGVATLTFGFKPDHKDEYKKAGGKRLTTYYFQYSGINSESEYENSSKWSNITDVEPPSDPCPGANNIVCVLKADFATPPTAADLTTYLASLTPSGTGASTYCTNNSHIFSKKP